MTEKQKKLAKALGIYGGVCFMLGFLPTFLIMNSRIRALKAQDEKITQQIEVVEDEQEPVQEPPEEIIYYQKNRVKYSDWFADLNELHMAKAQELGLSQTLQSRDEVESSGFKLVKLTDGPGYIVGQLDYSVPYLTKGAAKEVENIGKAFADSLVSKGFPTHRLVVTSVLRTEEDVAKLRKSGNVNSSDKSAHCYGTTFDISYTRYDRVDEGNWNMQPYELTKIFTEVLRDQKKAGNCLVKYESRQNCFHITSTLK